MKITIDGKELAARPGQTILDLAQEQGVEIPHICYRNDESCQSRLTSCLVCLVKVAGKFVPACATQAVDGMVVQSDTEEVKSLRRTSLELLLSDHVGDCYAPCQLACPAALDIPKMLRAILAGDEAAAIRTVKDTIPIPAVLGRICPKPCEKICRRTGLDSSVRICDMKRHVADVDLAKAVSYVPLTASATGKRVIVVGAGPTGLSAAYFLARLGHRVALYTQGKKLGGRLRGMTDLPESVLDAEIRTILAMPIDYYPNEQLHWTEPESLREIREAFDAVLLCTGPCDADLLHQSGLQIVQDRLTVDPKTWTTSWPGVFAAGTIFRAKSPMVVRSVADGHDVAKSIDRFLRVGKPTVSPPPFMVKSGKISGADLIQFAAASVGEKDAKDTLDNMPSDTSPAEAARCLHCDCRGREKCLLLKFSCEYQAQTRRFTDQDVSPLILQRSGNILYEPGKCIKCGLCITVTQQRGEELGLTFVGRGFDVQVQVPFGEPLTKALEKSALEAVQACPTAALSLVGDHATL